MRRQTTVKATALRLAAGVGVVLGMLVAGAEAAEGGKGEAGNPTLERVQVQARVLGLRAVAWYRRTPPMERITWGGLAASALLGLGVALERSVRVRRGKIIPAAYVERFQRRLGDGQLDKGKALDYCELNPSPAARVSLAAIRRWGRPVADLERAVALARQLESDRLRRHIGTLRRVAALSPLIGLLGTLTAAGRTLAALTPNTAWGPALAGALAPLTAGVALAILALVAYDGLVGRVEALAHDLDRIGAETVDAIALATAADTRQARTRGDAGGPARSPHPIRLPIPEDVVRQMERPSGR